ncbi:protein dimerization [Abeliophyllum distichum]|uniref:Protein dimerization n=1 Tax=Abeliophyllum distichum TaxID=126358 RepID=A0ABD1Q7Q8_9LAMI
MASEDFEVEEWDADFLDQLVQAEEIALSTRPTQPPPPPLPPPPQAAAQYEISYSPPRELSQRVHDATPKSDHFDSFIAAPPIPRGAHNRKEQEIDTLKKELGRVSKQLTILEKECSELREERYKKEEQLKLIHPRIETKDAKFHQANNVDSDRDRVISIPADPGISRECQNANSSNKLSGSWTKSCNTIGVQTDKTSELTNIAATSDLSATCGSKKLLGLWNSLSGPTVGRFLVPKLLATCEADFHVLFGYLNSSKPYKTKVNSPQNASDVALPDHWHPVDSIEIAKVSHLYSVLTKISNETSRLEDLFEALIDLCSLKNVIIVHRSLRVLHMILTNSFSMEKKFGKRDNVVDVELSSESRTVETNGHGSENKSLVCSNASEMLNRGQIPCGPKFSNVKNPFNEFFNQSIAASTSYAFWFSLFENMCQIAVMNKEEHIRCEALSVMNLILMRSNAYLEREKFAQKLVFQSLSQVLRREAGLCVQDRALQILYLLCNCPKVIAMLCSGSEEEVESACTADINENSTSEGLNEILIGLADCLVCSKNTSEELKLRRNAINFLAFLGASGKSGFEILLNHRLPKGTNFLTIILQSLVSDLDLEALESAQLPEVFRNRSLLIRETLILLNRLVSHPQYSIPVLRALTNRRDMASLTVDIANRLTRKIKCLWQDDNMTRQIRESEILELARVFKRRVFSFLGDNIS